MLFGRSLEGVKNMPGMCLKGACKVSGSTSSCQWDESDVICHDVILCHDVIIYDNMWQVLPSHIVFLLQDVFLLILQSLSFF